MRNFGTFGTISGNDESGYSLKLSGIHQAEPARVVAWSRTHLAVVTKGYSDNPGSRYSGLRSYYPSDTVVYRILEQTPCDLGIKVKLECSVSWQTRGHKPVSAPRLGA